jgi:hypothetical protein
VALGPGRLNRVECDEACKCYEKVECAYHMAPRTLG